MVPQLWAGMWSVSSLGALFRPTEQSIQGATVATGPVETPAGRFQSSQVRFRAGDGGTVEWWLSDEAVGGVARFRYTEPLPDDHGEDANCHGQPNATTMELIDHGDEAQSELGVL